MKNKLIAFCEEFADKVDTDTLTVSEFFGLVLAFLSAFLILNLIWKGLYFVLGA